MTSTTTANLTPAEIAAGVVIIQLEGLTAIRIDPTTRTIAIDGIPADWEVES